MNPYRSEAEIEEVVRGFETCETGADDFRHPQHLVVAAWYVDKMGRDEALDRMRAGLVRFLNHHGVDKTKYSEAVTVFWIDKIAAKLEEAKDTSIVEKCDLILRR